MLVQIARLVLAFPGAELKIEAMRYSLRTLLILLTVAPPFIGFWPHIKRRVLTRATQVTASDAAVVASVSSLIAIRIRLHLIQDNVDVGSVLDDGNSSNVGPV